MKRQHLRSRLRRAGCSAALLLVVLGAPSLLPALAQSGAGQVSPSSSAFDVRAVQALLSRGDAAAAAGNLVEARRYYDQAREASKQLLGFYRDLSGAFRGLDARIPREMDDKGRQVLDTLVQANMRLAALFRRQGQPEVAVPLLVEVVKTMTPSNESGRKAYLQLLEIGFVATPYTAPSSNPN